MNRKKRKEHGGKEKHWERWKRTEEEREGRQKMEGGKKKKEEVG